MLVTVRIGVSLNVGDGVGDGCRQCRRRFVSVSVYGVASLLVRGQRGCLVEGIVGQQGQSTIRLFVTLEVANSKAKSEGIQIKML